MRVGIGLLVALAALSFASGAPGLGVVAAGIALWMWRREKVNPPQPARQESKEINLADVDFVAIDVETAAPQRSSICQVGLVFFGKGEVVGEWSTYVNPQVPIGRRFTAIHGITNAMVRRAPVFGDVSKLIDDSLRGMTVVSHTMFDKSAITKAFGLLGLECPDCTWIDTCEVARSVWPELENHKLPTVSRHIGASLNHHDALSDARAAGHIILAAQNQGWTLDEIVRLGSKRNKRRRAPATA